MVSSSLPLHENTDQTASGGSLCKLSKRQSLDFKVFVPNVDQICKEDRMHLLLDMPGLDESSCEIELASGRVTVRGKVNNWTACNEPGVFTDSGAGLLERLSNDLIRTFQYCFDIPVDYERLHYAQFIEGTLHICVDRVGCFEDLKEILNPLN